MSVYNETLVMFYPSFIKNETNYAKQIPQISAINDKTKQHKNISKDKHYCNTNTNCYQADTTGWKDVVGAVRVAASSRSQNLENLQYQLGIVQESRMKQKIRLDRFVNTCRAILVRVLPRVHPTFSWEQIRTMEKF